MDPKDLKARFEKRKEEIAERNRASQVAKEKQRQQMESRRRAASQALKDIVHPYLLEIQQELGMRQFEVAVTDTEQSDLTGVSFRVAEGPIYEIMSDLAGGIRVRKDTQGSGPGEGPGQRTNVDGPPIDGPEDLSRPKIGELVKIAIDDSV